MVYRIKAQANAAGNHLQQAEEHDYPGDKMMLKTRAFTDWTQVRVWECARATGLDYLPSYDRGFGSVGWETYTALPDDPDSPALAGRRCNRLQLGAHRFSERVQ